MPIEIRQLEFVYQANTPLATSALTGVNLQVEDGEIIGIIGATGSGKSTLIQHINGLLKATSGTVVVDGLDISEKGKDKKIREKVGIVFQYPEHQLFEETVYEDVAFGPRNLGLSEETISKRVRKAMALVGLEEEIMSRNPLNLSGGQMRRVALAGVLAMEPKKLILDEPGAGLDPQGRKELYSLISSLHMQSRLTVIVVSHHMDELIEVVQRLVIMNNGQIALEGTPSDVFTAEAEIKRMGLKVPAILRLLHRLEVQGWKFPSGLVRMEDIQKELVRQLSS